MRHLVFTTCLALSLLQPLYAQTGQEMAAEVISKEGSGEWRADSQGDWSEASVSLQLAEGSYIRTGSRSKVGLLFRDQSQMRLNQNSLLIVRDVLNAGGASTRFELNQGRAWIQSKRIPDNLIMETPSAVAAIRGTDWDIEVGADGSTLLTVLHGAVELSNAFGTVTVNRNEQGVATIGAAPFVLQIRNPESRIQWVTQYQLRPGFYLLEPLETLSAPHSQAVELLTAGDLANAEPLLQGLGSPTALALLSDIYLYAGESTRVVDLLEGSPLLGAWPQLASLLAQAYFMQDETERATALISAQLQMHPDSVHLLLTRGEIAIFSGDAALATTTFEQVLAIDPDNDRAYYGLGRVYGEREFVSEALANLNAAIAANAGDASYPAEKATVETFANRFSAAEQALAQSLGLQPANAVALTGKGVLLLKQGKTEAAIQEFLKASLLEPRYARVLVYLAIAYYQQGSAELALYTLELAKEIDEKDPFPWFLESTIRKELFQPGASMQASRNAMERLPNLKSLNQVIIDQKGNTNLGAALANYGLSDWALKIAVDSYNPFWAGSALFLSNQVNYSDYVSLSEKFKGFMTNPLAFGAPNRYSSLIVKPGNYAALGGIYSELEGGNYSSRLTMPTLTVNGLNTHYFPISYFYSDNGYKLGIETRDKATGISFDTALEPTIRTYGLGITPGDKLRLFYFADEQAWQAGQQTVATNVNPVNFSIQTDNDQRQQAFGAQYVFSPEQKLEFSYTKFAVGIDQDTIMNSKTVVDVPPSRYSSDSDTISATTLDNFMETAQLRFDRKLGNHFLTAGVANIVTENHTATDSSSIAHSEFYFDGALLSATDSQNHSLTLANSVLDEWKYFLHYEYKAYQKLQFDFDLSRSAFDVDSSSTSTDLTNNFTYTTPQEPFSYSDDYVSAGINYVLNAENNIRLAYQDYLHFNLANTLNNTTTAGIPFNTEMLITGSMQQRSRLQWENTHFKDTYFDVYVDVIDTENDFFSSRNITLPTVVSGLNRIGQLSDRTDNLFIDDYKSRGFSADSVKRGELQAFGFDLNRVLTERMGVYFNFRHVNSTVIDGANKGKDFLNVPIQKARIGLTWSSAFRTKVAVQADYLKFAESDPKEYVSFARDGVYAKLSVVQEFMNRRLLAFSQLLYDGTVANPTRTFSVGLELRI